MRTVNNAVAVFAAIAFLSTSAFANSVVLSQDAYSYTVGGEFSAKTTDNFVQNYNSAAVVNGGFETFCIETTVDFTPGVVYHYTLSQDDSLGRTLTLGAAYLYYQFAEDKLAGYDYTDAATRNADAGLLQAAIWAFQHDQTYPGYPTLSSITSNPSSDIFYADAISDLQALGENPFDPSNGAYGVQVLEMWDSNGNAAQNQLVVTPDAASTGLLLAGVCGGMALVEIRRRKPAVARVGA